MNTDEFINKYSWMVRPCSIYQDEYSDCTSMRGRIHQYFVFGTTVDCAEWKRDENNCEKWKGEGDVKALKSIVENEKKRRNDRMESHLANDVWEKRDGPPTDWNTPLPEWFQKREAGSYLAARSREAKSGQPIIDENQTVCVIL